MTEITKEQKAQLKKLIEENKTYDFLHGIVVGIAIQKGEDPAEYKLMLDETIERESIGVIRQW